MGAEKMDVNEEQTEFTFTVRDGVTWSDGTPLNATTSSGAGNAFDPETKSEYTTALYPIKNAVAIDAGEMDLADLGVKATDERTLVVTLEGRPVLPAPGRDLDLLSRAAAHRGRIRRCGSRPAIWSPTDPMSSRPGTTTRA